jgi:hypothetical protein
MRVLGDGARRIESARRRREHAGEQRHKGETPSSAGHRGESLSAQEILRLRSLNGSRFIALTHDSRDALEPRVTNDVTISPMQSGMRAGTLSAQGEGDFSLCSE